MTTYLSLDAGALRRVHLRLRCRWASLGERLRLALSHGVGLLRLQCKENEGVANGLGARR